MASIVIRGLIAGSFFGVGLTYANVYPPAIIIDQLLLRNLHMLRVFLTATAISTLVVAILSKTSLFKPSPRPPQTISLFSPYDANIIGGALIGVGMAFTGACPGTILPQTTIGYTSAPFILIGAVLGGLLWALIGAKIRKPMPAFAQEHWTLSSRLGLGNEQTMLAFAASCIAVVCTSALLDGAKTSLTLSLKGGLAIGAAQAGSILLTTNSIGSSAAYEEAGRWILWFAQGKQGQSPSYRSLTFAAGALIGSWAFEMWNGIRPDSRDGIVPLTAVIGGACLSFGSRLAGGCTSGHGISGMAMGSVASFVSVGGMFGAGMAAVRFT